MNRISGLAPYQRSPSEVFDELKNKAIIFFDTETTGLNHVKDQVTEIAAIAVKGPNFEEIEQYHKKIKLTDKTLKRLEDESEKAKDPKFWGVSRVLKMNKYHQNPLQEENETEVLEGFKDFCKKYGKPILIGQNAKFDLSFIGSRIGEIPKERVYDTKLFAQYYLLPAVKILSGQDVAKEQVRERLLTKEYPSKKDKPVIDKSDPDWKKKLKKMVPEKKQEMSTSLEYLMKGFGHKEKGAHSSLVDVRSTITAFKRIMKFFEEYKDVPGEDIYKQEQGKAFKKELYYRLSPGKREFLKKQKQKRMARNVLASYLCHT